MAKLMPSIAPAREARLGELSRALSEAAAELKRAESGHESAEQMGKVMTCPSCGHSFSENASADESSVGDAEPYEEDEE